MTEEEKMDTEPASKSPVPEDLSKHAESKVEKPPQEVKEEKMDEDVDDDEEIGELHIVCTCFQIIVCLKYLIISYLDFQLGDKNAVLFTLDSMKTINVDNLPDSFFDLNVSDIKKILRDLRAQVQGTSEQPLLTAQLRELEEDKDRLNKLNRYQKTIIRIQFPDRYVLQGTFAPLDTIETVMDFVRTYLVQPDIDFHLCKFLYPIEKHLLSLTKCIFITDATPPKTILPKESRLFEVHCVPSAVLHFGTDTKQTTYLRDDILAKVSCGKASLKQALMDR